MRADLASLRLELMIAREHLLSLTTRASAQQAAYVATYGDDMATVSGTRRKYSANAAARKFGANAREAAAWQAVVEQDKRIAVLERVIARTIRDTPVPYTPADLKAARLVRDRFGWHRVVKVNAKSATVATEWSWTERVDLADVIEVRL